MDYRFHIVDVFTDTPFAGNQLAVIPDATGLDKAAMQSIAREFNFAESAFVFPAEVAGRTARVRIFNPAAEMAFAGHPTIGTACALAMHGHVVEGQWSMILEEGIGPVPVEVEQRDGAFRAALRLPGKVDVSAVDFDNGAAAALLSLRPEQVREAFCASVGFPFCFIQLDSKTAVDAALFDKVVARDVLTGETAKSVFFFAGESTGAGRLYARMCAPAFGIEEDPATGSACAALVGAMAERYGSIDFTIRQGEMMGRPSDIEARATVENGELTAIYVSGAVSHFASGVLSHPPA